MRYYEIISESSSKSSLSIPEIIQYITKHHNTNLHKDYTDYITSNFDGFELKTIPVDSIPADLPKLDKEKVEQYRQMDFSKAPPIVIGGSHILDGYHRINAAKVLGIKNIKAYVGIPRKPKSLKEDALLNEAELNEAFLNDLAKKLGGSLVGKANEHITTVNDFATGLKVIGKAVSTEQYLTTSTFLIKKAIKTKLKTLRTIPKFNELNNLINQHWPQGRTLKDFFKSLLLVCGLNAVLAITSKMNNAASALKGGVDAIVDKLIDNYANIDQIVGSLISSGVGYLANVLKVMGVSNAVLFQTLAGINAKISSVKTGAGLAEQFEI